MTTMSLKHALWRFEAIWNCRDIDEIDVSKACIVTVFEAIWNCREIDENDVYKACLVSVFEAI